MSYNFGNIWLGKSKHSPHHGNSYDNAELSEVYIKRTAFTDTEVQKLFDWTVTQKLVEIKNWKLTLTNTLPYLDVDPAKYQEQSTPLTEREEIERVRAKARQHL